MDPKIRLRRHAQLWESGTASVQRLALGSVIFAVVMMLNVIKPYYENKQSPEVIGLRASVEELENEQKKNVAHIAGLKAIENTLVEIERDIRKTPAPWDDDIKTLVDHCQGGCPSDTQAIADGVIENIAVELGELIVVTFSNAIDDANFDSETHNELAQHATDIERAIEGWKNDKLATVWYRTPEMKSQTAAQAGNLVQLSAQEAENKLGDLSQAAMSAVRDTTAAMEEKQNGLNEKEVKLDSEVKEKNETIKHAMNRALPGWATGLFTVEDMIKNYPWILISLIVFMLANAWNAGRHFRGMADAEGWSIDDRSDPLLSSPWTLTWRGNKGSAVTAIYYLAVLGVLIYCLVSYQKFGP